MKWFNEIRRIWIGDFPGDHLVLLIGSLQSYLLTMRVLQILLVYAAILFSFNTCAKDSEAFIVYTESWAPYNYEFERQVVGISTDTVREMFEAAKLDYEILLVPWARGYQAAQKQSNAFLYMTKRTPEREVLFNWVGPLEDARLSLYRLATRNDLSIKDIAELKNFRVGVERDGSSHEKLKQMGYEVEKNMFPVASFSQLLGMLFKQRIDFVISEDTSLLFQMKLTGYRNKDVVRELEFASNGEFYLAVNKSIDAKILATLQSHLDEIKKNGRWQEIRGRYLDN